MSRWPHLKRDGPALTVTARCNCRSAKALLPELRFRVALAVQRYRQAQRRHLVTETPTRSAGREGWQRPKRVLPHTQRLASRAAESVFAGKQGRSSRIPPLIQLATLLPDRTNRGEWCRSNDRPDLSLFNRVGRQCRIANLRHAQHFRADVCRAAGDPSSNQRQPDQSFEAARAAGPEGMKRMTATP
jgi:hypothetical protein